MTVRQIVEKFGGNDPKNVDWTNISDGVRHQYELGQMESTIYIVHMVKPNEGYDEKKLESKYKKYVSY